MAGLALQLLRDPEAAAIVLEPKRRMILERLQVEANSATGLSKVLEMPRQKVNYHLRELERVGLVEEVSTRRKGNVEERIVRAKAAQYLISPEVLGQLGDSPEERRDRFSVAYLISAAGRVIRDLGVLVHRAGKAGKRLSTMTVEVDVRFKNAEARAQFADELVNFLAEQAAKYHDERTAGGREFRFVVGAYPKITKQEADGPEAAEIED